MTNNENINDEIESESFDNALEAQNSANEVLGALFGTEGDGLEKAGIFMLMDDIKNDSVRPVIDWIFRNNLSPNQPEHLTLILNSSVSIISKWVGAERFRLRTTSPASRGPCRA